jgi:hypothetical protein
MVGKFAFSATGGLNSAKKVHAATRARRHTL